MDYKVLNMSTDCNAKPKAKQRNAKKYQQRSPISQIDIQIQKQNSKKGKSRSHTIVILSMHKSGCIHAQEWLHYKLKGLNHKNCKLFPENYK